MSLRVFSTSVRSFTGFSPQGADALLDLVDGLAGNTKFDTPVKVSLSPLFRRGHSSLHDAVDKFFEARDPAHAAGERDRQQQELTRLIAERLQPPESRPFWLLATDVTPAPRPFAKTLADRGVVYAPNATLGNKPIAVGHNYSALVALPERTAPHTPPWVVPLSVRRVASEATGTATGAQQLEALLADEALPFGQALTVNVVDSAYSALSYLGHWGESDNLLIVARLPSNRTVYRNPPPSLRPPGKGHPPWYGERFALNEPVTWGPPQERLSFATTTHKGRVLTVHLEVWYDLKLRGKRTLPMHRYPFTLIRGTVTDRDGRLVFKRPQWLMVFGKRRHEITARQAWDAYRQRYDIEHFFRFGKQRLLLDSYQTPVVEHDENWWQLVSLAYVQLWLAQPLAQVLPNPWERYALPPNAAPQLSPALVQRDFERIIRQVGTPALAPKPRGKSPGRRPGVGPGRRPTQPVIIKKAKKQLPQVA